MKNLLKAVFTGALGCTLASVNAQTVTVAKSTPADFNSVQSAISHFSSADPNITAPNFIQILDSELYDEVITVNVPVTLEGAPGARPVLAVQANAEGRAASSGLVIKLPTATTDTVVLRNMAIIPSLAARPLSAGISVVNNNLFLFLDNVLLTANNGFNQPTSTDGLIVVPGAQTHFGDDGLVFGESNGTQIEGAGAEVLMRDTIITNIRGNSGSESNSCGIIVNNNTTTDTAIAYYRKLRIEDGCIISANNGRGIWQAAIADFQIDAPTERALLIRNSSMGLLLSAGSVNERSIRGGIFAYNLQQGVYENSFWGTRCSIEDSIIARNTFMNIRISNAATGPMSIKNTTIAYDGTGNYQSLLLDIGSHVTFQDCILAGDGSTNNTYNRITNTSGPITLINTAIVEAGPAALRVPTFTGSGIVTGNGVASADPEFVNTTVPESPDFFDVASRSYATAGSNGTPLSGGADYISQTPITEQTVTISKSGPANHTTIQGAINSLAFDPNIHYTLQILDSSVYDEMIDLTVPATIVGTGSARPILAVQGNSNGYDLDGAAAVHVTNWDGNAGLLINIPSTLTTCSVALKNLIIIPSKIGTPPVAGVVNKANNFFLDLENVLITSNDGNDAPVSTDGLSSVTQTASHVSFLVSGAHLGSITSDRAEGAGVEVAMRNCIFTNIRASLGDTWRSGFYMYRTYYRTPRVTVPALRPMAFRSLRVGEGCRFNYNSGDGLRCASGLVINSPNQRAEFIGNLNNGLWCDMTQGRDEVVGAVVANNGRLGVNEGVGNDGARLKLTNAIIANNDGFGSYNRLGSLTQSPTLYTNVTIANNGLARSQNTIQTSANNSAFNLTLVDTILAGNGSQALDNITSLTAGGTFTLQNTAVVSEGPHALATTIQTTIPGIAPRLTKTGTDVNQPVVSGLPVAFSDPKFMDITNPHSPNFYAVRNAAYGTLNSAGGPLVGGGMYLPGAKVTGWTLY